MKAKQINKQTEEGMGYLGYTKMRNKDGTVSVYFNGKNVSNQMLPYCVDVDEFDAIEITELNPTPKRMENIKCITFDKEAQENLPKWVKDKMRKDRKQAETEQSISTTKKSN